MCSVRLESFEYFPYFVQKIEDRLPDSLIEPCDFTYDSDLVWLDSSLTMTSHVTNICSCTKVLCCAEMQKSMTWLIIWLLTFWLVSTLTRNSILYILYRNVEPCDGLCYSTSATARASTRPQQVAPQTQLTRLSLLSWQCWLERQETRARHWHQQRVDTQQRNRQ